MLAKRNPAGVKNANRDMPRFAGHIPVGVFQSPKQMAISRPARANQSPKQMAISRADIIVSQSGGTVFKRWVASSSGM